MSKAWYEPTEMPWREQHKIRSHVAGRPLATLDGFGLVSRVHPATFATLFTLNREWLLRGDFTAPVEENDYRDGCAIVTESGLAGLCVTKTGWLTSVYSNEPHRGFVSAVADLVSDSVKYAVCIVTGDDFISPLVRLYMKVFGMYIAAVTVDDRGRMTECYGEDWVSTFTEHRGIPHHVFITKHIVPHIKQFDDYFDALHYVEGLHGAVPVSTGQA